MKQFVLTPAMGKRLIAKAVAAHPAMQAALKQGTVVIVAGTTNAYVAQEVLAALGLEGFSARGFRRGVVTPPGLDGASLKADFPGDVVLVRGQWQKAKEIFDVVNDLKAGDLIVKGGNALDLDRRLAGVLIAHPMAGTIGAAVSAVIGRRVGLLVPIGLEKRICGDLTVVAAKVNAPTTEGPRMMLLPGEVFTELDAIALLTGAKAQMLAAGGVCGAEGSVWLGVCGEVEQVQKAKAMIESLAGERLCQP